jgi:tannase/feruloyl esterase
MSPEQRVRLTLRLLVICSTLAATAPAVATSGVACSYLEYQSFLQTTIGSATVVPADPISGRPEHCQVNATISPGPGSRIGVVYRLPVAASWNGKLLGIGGSGWAGDLTIGSATLGLSRGYATLQTNTGHLSPNPFEFTWSLLSPGKLNEEAVIDFGHRAVHLMTTVGKEVARAYYGRPHEFAYFQGCSTGGRQGFQEVQRYPDDYDGVISGAPVYNVGVFMSAIWRTQVFHAEIGSNLLPAHVPLLATAVAAACDERRRLDRLADGIITNPLRCDFDPRSLQCADPLDGSNPICLSARQVQTVRKMYRGRRTPDGELIAEGITHGSEPDWALRSVGNPAIPLGLNAVLGSPFFSYMVKLDPTFNLFDIDVDDDIEEAKAAFATRQIEATNPQVMPFIRNGGKWIIWHGFNDPGPSPKQTAKYYETVVDALSKRLHTDDDEDHGNGLRAAQQHVRYFLAPGVFHCGGGPGPDIVNPNLLTALAQWVEHGAAPESIVATKSNSPLTRPMCPYPQLARYTGSGDTNDPSNFVCVNAIDRGPFRKGHDSRQPDKSREQPRDRD